MSADPFDLTALPFGARRLASRALALAECSRLYREIQLCEDGPFEHRVLRVLGIGADISTADIDAIPPEGPTVVAANHPHGAVDGLLLADIVRRIRPDVRVLANHLLARIPELHDLCFFVDPFEGPAAAARSRAGLRAAHLWLRRGGALIAFPSGEVAHRRDSGSPIDSAWKDAVVRLAANTRSTIVPAWIGGSNSRTFYALGRIHPALRTLRLARELLQARGRTFPVRVGQPLRDVESNGVHRVRRASDALADRAIEAEIAALPADACLATSGSLDVYCAAADAVPRTVKELGRLRELAFRAVGEGTGRTLDLDPFDERYLHLFVWDRDRRQVAGAYRVGRTDEIVRAYGVDGLYTRTLFRYDQRLLDRMGAPALELGRSFVRGEYQKSYNALLLLWRGIGQFVVRHPEYRLLFGPVSISARYSDTSHQLLVEFLRQNHFDRELGDLVAALHPARRRTAPVEPISPPQSVADVDALVARAEADGKGLPVLLRQYLKLNARVLGFNVDPAFGDALDALMVVDLTTLDRAILNRYLGREGAAQFLTFHHRAHGRAA